MASLSDYFTFESSLLGTATVVGSAATTLTLGGLDLSAYKAFKVIGKLKNATGSTCDVSMTYNADTTATNYHNERVNASSTSVTSLRENNAVIQRMVANSLLDFELQITSDVDGKPRALFAGCEGTTSSIIFRNSCHLWITAANVTGITLTGSVASSLDVGSTFSVWGIK